MKTIHYLTVTSESSGQRLDNFLMSHLKGLPKSRLYRAIRKGEFRINKKRTTPAHRLKNGDSIRIPPVSLPSPSAPKKLSKSLADLLEQCIIFEDRNFIGINKPSGIAVHGGSGIDLGIIEAFRQLRPQLKFLELAHRLDRQTSGCLLLAKKSSILKEIHELLRKGHIKKTYIALVKGRWLKSLRSINVPLYKNRLQSGERMVHAQKNGKPSLTRFCIIKNFTHYTLLKVIPLTGRTHQIRVHTQYANHPIVGDEKYGDKEVNKTLKEMGCQRLFLHASELKFTLISTNQTIKLKAKLPIDLNKVLKRLNLIK